MRENNFPQVWVPDPENRDQRQLLWHRHRLVQMRTRVMNQLQAFAMRDELKSCARRDVGAMLSKTRRDGKKKRNASTKVSFLYYTMLQKRQDIVHVAIASHLMKKLVTCRSRSQPRAFGSCARPCSLNSFFFQR
jgi:hypothetical protein